MNNPNSRSCCKIEVAQRELLVEMIHLILGPGCYVLLPPALTLHPKIHSHTVPFLPRISVWQVKAAGFQYVRRVIKSLMTYYNVMSQTCRQQSPSCDSPHLEHFSVSLL